MGGQTAIVALAASMVALAMGGAGADGPGTELGCGALAPFLNTCSDCCSVLGPEPSAWANLLGFAGALEMRLEGPLGWWAWRCMTVLVDDPLPPGVESCTGPEAMGQPPAAGTDVSLRCFAWPVDPERLVPPIGPWGCEVIP